MELKMVGKTDTSVEIEFKGENETLLNLLKQKLLRDERVVSATFIVGHPLLDVPRLHVEVKPGTKERPENLVKNAAKDVRKELDEFETLLLRGG